MTFAVDGTWWVGSIAIYLRATRTVSRGGAVGLLPLIGIPTVAWIRTPFTSFTPGDLSPVF